MKAVRYHAYGGPDVLALDDVPIPEIGPGEVLVKVHASSINPADWKFRAGWFAEWVSLAMPFTPGSDVAGLVDRVGADVVRFRPGDRVYGMTMPPVGGACAEYIAIRDDALAIAPHSIPLDHAAGVPLAALTAWAALMDGAGLDAGRTVLIHAAAGGVGSFAVQLAKAAGATVIATASAGNATLIRSLGADQVIDYHATDFSTIVSGIDVVLDSVGGTVQAKSLTVLRRGGVLVTLDPQPPAQALCDAHGVRGVAVALVPDGARLERIARLIDAGKVRVIIDSVFPLAEAADAHRHSEAGHARGKILLHVA